MASSTDDTVEAAVSGDDETVEAAVSGDDETIEATGGGGADLIARSPGGAMGRFQLEGVIGAGGLGIVLAGRDPELDRRVAIKVLRPGGDGRRRIVREAQAMARVAHPNTVTIYEVGRAGDELFIAMEYVDGTSLRSWLAARARAWREIVAMFVGAGRGLAAMHAAGLVHRDFKADNVMVRADGRPQVGDFGLAAEGIAPAPEDVAAAAPGASLAVGGEVVGTPSVMAPEQWRGAAVDARTDQFAFAVSLWLALFGLPPFAGDDVPALRDAVLADRRRPRPLLGPVPSAIAAALDRGMAHAPDARWPDVGALLRRLEHVLGARRRRVIAGSVGGAVAAAAAVVAIVAMRDAPKDDPCPAPDARSQPVWGAARAAAVQAQLLAADPAVGAARFAAAATMLDRGVAAWSAMHVAACRATRVEGRQSDSALDLRMRCLDGWLDGADRAVIGLERATDPPALEGAVKAVSAVGAVDRCADAAALQATSGLPAAPAARAEAQAIVDEVVAIDGERRASRFDGLPARVDALVARSRALDHAGTLARVLGVRWRVTLAMGDVAGAIVLMREATEAAARGHNDGEAATTWAVMAQLTAQFQGQPDDARVMIAAARAAAARAGDPPLLRARVATYEADVLTAAGDGAGARDALAQARGLLVAAGADQPGSPEAPRLAELLQTEGEQAWDAHDVDRAAALLREAAARFDRAYGPETVDAAGVYLSLAQVLRDGGHPDDALAAVAHTVRIRARAGDSAALAIAISVRSMILADLGRSADAIADAERALAMARAVLASDDAELLAITADVAVVYDLAGRRGEALALWEALIAGATRAEIVTSNVATWWLHRADLERRLGRCAAAVPHFTRAVEIATEVLGPDSRLAGGALRGRGLCEAELGRRTDAIASLARALALPSRTDEAADVELARATLDRLRR